MRGGRSRRVAIGVERRGSDAGASHSDRAGESDATCVNRAVPAIGSSITRCAAIGSEQGVRRTSGLGRTAGAAACTGSEGVSQANVIPRTGRSKTWHPLACAGRAPEPSHTIPTRTAAAARLQKLKWDRLKERSTPGSVTQRAEGEIGVQSIREAYHTAVNGGRERRALRAVVGPIAIG